MKRIRNIFLQLGGIYGRFRAGKRGVRYAAQGVFELSNLVSEGRRNVVVHLVNFILFDFFLNSQDLWSRLRKGNGVAYILSGAIGCKKQQQN